MKRILTTGFVLLLFLQCTKHPTESEEISYIYTIPPQVDDGLDTGSLSSVGMDESIFENLVVKINVGIYSEIHAILVMKENKLVFEKYWPGHDFSYSASNYHGDLVDFDLNTRHNTHSTTKSFTSALVGIAIDRGILQSKDDVVFDYLPDAYRELRNEGREHIQIAHCLTMASGLQWNQWDVGIKSNANDLIRFNSSSDPIRYLLSKPVVAEPGTRFYYNGGTVDLLGKLISNAADESVQSFAADHLFLPLGITNYNWVILQPSGLTCCHGDIHITPRDMTKFGQLYLDEGKWGGQQIISHEWVEQSTQCHIRLDFDTGYGDGYGYLWWLKNFQVNGREYQSFKSSGWGGQEIFVFDDLDMVVVFTGANYVTYAPCDEIVHDYILASLTSIMP